MNVQSQITNILLCQLIDVEKKSIIFHICATEPNVNAFTHLLGYLDRKLGEKKTHKLHLQGKNINTHKKTT